MRASVYPMEGAVSTTSLPLQMPELYLEFCSRGDSRYKDIRSRHYVKDKGVHAQQVHFLVWYKGEIAGIISGSSAVYATPERDKFFGINKENREKVLRGIINNIVFRLECQEKNLGTRVLAMWRKVAPIFWEHIYGVSVFGFETLIIGKRDNIKEGGEGSEPKDNQELIGDFKNTPGVLYKADNWVTAGETTGFTKHHDEQGLNRSFKVVAVRPKIVMCKWRDGYTQVIESEGQPTWQAGQKWEKADGSGENEDTIRRLRRRYPDITKEKWEVFSKELRVLASEMSTRRKECVGKMVTTNGRRVYEIRSSGSVRKSSKTVKAPSTQLFDLWEG